MRWFRKWRLRFRSLFDGSRLESDLEDELRDYLDREIERTIAAGSSPEEARRLALSSLSGAERVKEECRDARGVRWFEDILSDLRFAVRTLRKAPVFTVTVVGALGALHWRQHRDLLGGRHHTLPPAALPGSGTARLGYGRRSRPGLPGHAVFVSGLPVCRGQQPILRRDRNVSHRILRDRGRRAAATCVRRALDGLAFSGSGNLARSWPGIYTRRR
jgi:hypothetical protein